MIFVENKKNMKPQESVYKDHAENREFESRLAFYKDELSIFENQLENVAKEERHQRQLAKIEKFQNQLEIQKNNINDLTHELKRDEKIIDKQFKIANLKVKFEDICKDQQPEIFNKYSYTEEENKKIRSPKHRAFLKKYSLKPK